MTLALEVVVTTYNAPRFLDLCLSALAHQSHANFNVCVADDGSTADTRERVEYWQQRHFGSRLRTVWHEDKGFRKNKILNAAIATSAADYLIFIDGDCLAGPDFVSRHVRLSESGKFCTGGVVRLSTKATQAASIVDIETRQIFTVSWLRQHASLTRLGTLLKLSLLPLAVSGVLEKITPVNKKWSGGNSSAWRKDLLSVNGFEESLAYGAEDVELGIRLNHFGVEGKHLRYSAPLLHLDHARTYVDEALVAENLQYCDKIKTSYATKAVVGISQSKS